MESGNEVLNIMMATVNYMQGITLTWITNVVIGHFQGERTS